MVKLLPAAVFIMLFVTSCKTNSNKTLTAFNKEPFDLDIIQSLPLYDSFKNVILTNMKSIVEFRQTHRMDLSDEDNFSGAGTYRFYKADDPSVDPVCAQTLPADVSKQLLSIYSKLGAGKISGFYFSAHKPVIEIQLKETYSEMAGLRIFHTLTWSWRHFKYDNAYTKDSLLPNMWRYTIYGGKKLIHHDS